MEAHRRFEHVFVVNGDDERCRPDLSRGQGNRAANQAQADDANLLKNWRLAFSSPTGLDDRNFHQASFDEKTYGNAETADCIACPRVPVCLPSCPSCLREEGMAN